MTNTVLHKRDGDDQRFIFLTNDIQPNQNYFVQTAKQSSKVLRLNETWFFKCHMLVFHYQIILPNPAFT